MCVGSASTRVPSRNVIMTGNGIFFVCLRMGRTFALLALAFCAARAGAQQDPKTWHILIEPTFMQPQVSFPIAGAKDTVLVPGYLDEGGPEYFTKEQWNAAGLTWDKFKARATQNAIEKKVTGEAGPQR